MLQNRELRRFARKRNRAPRVQQISPGGGKNTSDFQKMSSHGIKNISLFPKGKSMALFRRPCPHEGRFAIVTLRWVRDAVDAFVQARKRGRMDKGVRRSRVVLASRRWR